MNQIDGFKLKIEGKTHKLKEILNQRFFLLVY